MKPKITKAFIKKAYKLGFNDNDIKMYEEHAEDVEIMLYSNDKYHIISVSQKWAKKNLGIDVFLTAFITACIGKMNCKISMFNENTKINIPELGDLVFDRGMTDEEIDRYYKNIR